MHIKVQKQLDELLVEILAILQANQVSINDYQSLKMRAIEDELKEEVQALKGLLEDNPEQFAEKFLSRCQERAIKNADSCLQFFSMPHGICNKLFWRIAELVFEPKTMGEILRILLPEVTTYLRYEPYLLLPKESEPSYEEIKKAQRDPQIRFITHPIDNLNQEPCLDFFYRMTSAGGLLFDLMSLSTLNIKLHQTFYAALQRNYPQLSSKIYHHNIAFKVLENHLLLLAKQGQSLYEYINCFANELRLGGEKMTGNVFASLNAQIVTTDFMEFVESLPSELKEELLLLENNNIPKRTIASVIEHLKAEKCVEIAAKDLQSILSNPANWSVLEVRPNLSPEQYLYINRQYGRHHPLVVEGSDASILIPQYYLERNLSSITIHNSYVYLSLLLSIPPILYSQLLRYAKITCNPPLSPLLGDMLMSGALNPEQLDAFYQAIVDNVEKLGGGQAVINFAIGSKNDELMKAILSALASENELIVFLMLTKASNLKVLWGLISEKDLPSIIREQLSGDNH